MTTIPIGSRVQITPTHWLVPDALGTVIGFRERGDGRPLCNRLDVELDEPFVATARPGRCVRLFLNAADLHVIDTPRPTSRAS